MAAEKLMIKKKNKRGNIFMVEFFAKKMPVIKTDALYAPLHNSD